MYVEHLRKYISGLPGGTPVQLNVTLHKDHSAGGHLLGCEVTGIDQVEGILVISGEETVPTEKVAPERRSP